VTKLQNHTAEELLEILVSVHPDISHALYNFLRMGDTPLTFTAKKQSGSGDKIGQGLWMQSRTYWILPFLNLLTLRQFGSGEKREQIGLSLGNTLRIHILVLAKNSLASIRGSIRRQSFIKVRSYG